MKKAKPIKVDGLSPKDLQKIRNAIRQIWQRSYPRRLCVERSITFDGFPYCEKCGKTTPKTTIDHITAVGDILDGGIERMFTSSANLQALCRECHREKTNRENKKRREKIRGVCIEEGCFKSTGNRLHHCEAHYYRLRRTGKAGEKPILEYEWHGRRKSAEYRAWSQMWQRCTNKKLWSYKYYGKRGIDVCDRWKSFHSFFKDMGERPGLKHSIDRIDNDGNYEPSNCRWASQKEQRANRSDSKGLKKKRARIHRR